jgi:hypothetical protein
MLQRKVPCPCQESNDNSSSSSIISHCDILTVKLNYKPSTTTEFISVLLLATCFGFSEKPSSGMYKLKLDKSQYFILKILQYNKCVLY